MSAPNRVDAAVLVPVFERAEGGERVVVLVRRTDRGVHGGQLAFPGGKREPDDRTALETALRESEEEIGLTSADILATEDLPELDTFTTRFRIRPFLGWIRRPSVWRPDPREIAEVLEVPASELANEAARGTMTVPTPDYPSGRRFAYIRVGPYRLWGASYRMLLPILPRLVHGDEPGEGT